MLYFAQSMSGTVPFYDLGYFKGGINLENIYTEQLWASQMFKYGKIRDVPYQLINADSITIWQGDFAWALNAYAQDYDQLDFAYTVGVYVPVGATDSISITDSATGNLTFISGATDAVSTTDTLTAQKRVEATITDAIALTDVLDGVLEMGVEATDAIACLVEADIAGAVYEGWVMNVDIGAHSRYVWPAFNSFAVVDGVYYGASRDGIYALDDLTDDGTEVSGYVMSGVTNFDADTDKRMLRGYLGVKANGDMQVRVTVGANETWVYDCTVEDEAMLRRRIEFGRGLSGVYWQFTVENVAGADFEADFLALYPVALKRRFDGNGEK